MKKILFLLVVIFAMGKLYAGKRLQATDSLKLVLRQTENDTIKLECLSRITDNYCSLHELDSAEKYAYEMIRFGKGIDNLTVQGAGFYTLSVVSTFQNDFETALRFSLKSLDCYETAVDTAKMGKAMNVIGQLYMRRNNYDRSIYYFSRSFQLRETTKDTLGLAYASLSLASAYIYRHQKESFPLDSGEFYVSEAIRYSKAQDTTDPDSPLYNSYEAFAIIHALKGQREKAIEIYLRLLAFFEENELIRRIPNTLSQLGRQYRKIGRLDKAEEFLYKSLDFATKIDDPHAILRLQLNLSDLHYDQGDVETAFQELRNYHISYDSMVNANQNKALLELETQYKTEEKEKQILLLEEEKKVSALQQERQAILLTLVVVAAVLALLFFTSLFFFQRSRSRRQRLELERKLLRAQMNPHFIFNSLSSIQRLYIDGDLDLANDFLSDFANLLREILEATGKQRISLRDEIRTLKRYLNLEEARLDGKMSWDLVVDDGVDLQQSMVPPLIIQPFVENAIWHGIVPKDSPGHITIELVQSDDQTVHCKVSDNGVGLEKNGGREKLHESKGIKLSEMRLGKKGAVKIEALPAGGVVATLEIGIQYENQSGHR